MSVKNICNDLDHIFYLFKFITKVKITSKFWENILRISFKVKHIFSVEIM